MERPSRPSAVTPGSTRGPLFELAAGTVRGGEKKFRLPPIRPGRCIVEKAGAVHVTANVPEDRELIGRIAEGDKKAFAAFYERYARRVLATLRKRAGDEALAEELAQEVFVAVWTKAGCYRPDRGEPEVWLYTIARNKLTDHWRRVGRLGAALGIEAEDYDVPAEPPGEGSGWKHWLEKAIAALSPEQRQAVELVYYEGMTFKETAERVGVPLGTLKWRIHAALGTLRDRMKGLEGAD